MKKILLLTVMVATFAFMSCSSTSSLSDVLSSTSNSTAKTMGSSCGSALAGLYKSYKSAGNKVNINDSSVLTNAMKLSTSIAGLKENGKNADYRKSYIAGMIAGSAGTLTQISASSIYDQLLKSASSFTGLNSSSSSSAKSAASTALSTILGLMSGK